MGLKEYKAKRDFSRTREPSGSVKKETARNFVVQKHAATRLHYDFRLEMEGVLKSWAVPKGFPTSRGDKRLAVQVEDHPVDYASFEGTIPEGNYGAGAVMVWDQGTYHVAGDDPSAGVKAGKLHIFLSGKKLKGEWALVRMRSRDESAKPQWLLFKAGEDARPFSRAQENESVVTGRTLEEIAGAKKKNEWQSNRQKEPTKPGVSRSRTGARTPAKPRRPRLEFSGLVKGAPTSKPAFIEPMKAQLAAQLPRGDEWIYEIKFDGIRALAIKQVSGVQLFSRSENNLTAKYPELVEALRTLPVEEAVLDGEIVAVDEQGRSSFQLLQNYHASTARPPLFYYIFDAPNIAGRNVRELPLERRKELALRVLEGAPPVLRFSAALTGDPEKVVERMKGLGLEGLVAKRKDSAYLAGARSSAWLKFKWRQEQEFVIGGFTEPKGARSKFGALLVGYYEGDRLMFAGKVGTGFNEKSLQNLHDQFQGLVREDCPFANLPEKRTGRFGGGLTSSQMRLCTWLEPRLVCQVQFAEWTRDNHLRQPAFVGIREDKKPREVIREKPV